MRKPFFLRVSPFEYCVIVTALILVGLSVAELVVTARLLRAFRHAAIQIPGSNIVEWQFVNMDPDNIDSGPTTAKFIMSGCCLFAALLAMLWIVLQWYGFRRFKIQKLGVMSCIAAVANTISSLGFTIYTFAREADNELPEYHMYWSNTTFTREFYVCDAFPSIFESADKLYGFRACDVAQVAKWLMVCIFCLSVVLAAMGITLGYASGLFNRREQMDNEKAWPTKSSHKVSASELGGKAGHPKDSEPARSYQTKELNVTKPPGAHVGKSEKARWA